MIYVFDVETTRIYFGISNMAKENDEIVYFEYDLRGIKINLMDVSDIKCDEI